MFKSILLGSALGVALLAAPVMAADFQALAHLQGAALTPLKDAALAAVEGGALCAGSTTVFVDSGGIPGMALCSITVGTVHIAAFSVTNQLPLTGVLFVSQQ
jgi:hypothetical protein